MNEPFAAWRFDGRTAEPHPASLRVEGDALVIESSEASELRVPIARTRFSEPFENTPRIVYTDSAGAFEVPDGRGFSRAIEAAGFVPGPVVRLQRFWPAASAAVAILVAALAYAYFYGVPLAARWAAGATPAALQERMGQELLGVLDVNFLAPSALPAETRQLIEVRFASAALRSAPDYPVRLEFRTMRADEQQEEESSESDEPPGEEPDQTINAFSLPGGIIVLLDGLVAAADPDQVFAVLGHELGHVVYAHSMRQLFQSAGVAVLAGLAWGDFSGVAASIPMALGVLRYGRDLERESDGFAVRFLADDGLGVEPLCQFFELVVELEREKGIDDFPEFLSTHPDTSKRLAQICPEKWGQAPSALSPSFRGAP